MWENKPRRQLFCRGCGTCFLKDEEHCPLEDDRDLLIRRMEDSDGVVFATPNYSLQVSGIMKTFLDRLAFVSRSGGDFT